MDILYEILHGYIKECKYITMSKMWFLVEDKIFHNVFEDKPIKRHIAKNKPSKYMPTINHMTLQEGIVIK